MARYARIEDGRVAAIEHIDLPEGPTIGVDIFAGLTFVATENPDVAEGWLFANGGFTPPPDPVVPVPVAVSPLQMRRALRGAGLKEQADAYLASLDEAAQEAWEYCVEVRRANEFIITAGAALGKSEAEIDDLFRLAATL